MHSNYKNKKKENNEDPQSESKFATELRHNSLAFEVSSAISVWTLPIENSRIRPSFVLTTFLLTSLCSMAFSQ